MATKSRKLTEREWIRFDQKRSLMIKEIKANPEKINKNTFWMLTMMSPPPRGSLMEKRHIKKHPKLLTKIGTDVQRGDFVTKSGSYYEYKFSLVNEKRNCCFLQIRLFQDCDYILEVYDSIEKEFYIFLVPHEEMKQLIKEHGRITHGTEKDNDDKNKMYSLRPKLKSTAKEYAIWKILCANFSITESQLKKKYTQKQSK